MEEALKDDNEHQITSQELQVHENLEEDSLRNEVSVQQQLRDNSDDRSEPIAEDRGEQLPGIETFLHDSNVNEQQEENVINESCDTTTNIDMKLIQLDEEKRLREEVKKSFQKASHREQSCHVRIDNFQRPLTLRTLITWLEEKINIKVDESNVWVNNIKTHCYVTFQSVDESKLCKDTIEGLKYPATNPLSLVVNYTKLSASEAAGSPEAALKYQDWLAKQNTSVSIMKRLGPRKENLVVHTDGAGSGPSSLGKRKSLGQGGGIGGAMFGVIRNTLNAAASAQEHEQTKSPRINRNTTPRGLSDGHRTVESLNPPDASEELPLEKSSVPTKTKNNSRNPKLTESNLNEKKKVDRKELTLDDLFKKTKTTPQLYWLPINDEEVARRKQQKKK